MKENTLNSNENNENRRSFLKKIGGAAAAAGTAGIPALVSGAAAQTSNARKKVPEKIIGSRANTAYQLRVDAAQRYLSLPPNQHPNNGDETRYPNFIGNFSKSLPHNNLGEVDVAAYNALLTACTSGDPNDYALIPMGGTVKLVNPQAANAFQMEGADCHYLLTPAPPQLSSSQENAEILEVYWQAVTRDLPYAEFANSIVIETAVRELRRFPVFRTVRANTIFRGETNGDHIGDYISQFLLKPIPYGNTTVEQRYRVPVAGDDQMTSYGEWLNIQNGVAPSSTNIIDPTPRYIRNGRDLAEYVHLDTPFQAYHNAALIMLGWGDDALSDTNPYKTTANQEGFVQFGTVHILDMVSRAAIAALKAAWAQKWNVHRRLRPEAFGGIIHNQLTGATKYPVSVQVGGSTALEMIFSQNGNYLLPMAFPEGSPTHPAYPAGHATTAGACSTILKAFFNENFEIPDPVAVNHDGTALVPYSGPTLRIGHEVNKLAANISLGRDTAGVHWRSDGVEGMRLGEQVAIHILKDYAATYNESFAGFTFTKFDGTSITI